MSLIEILDLELAQRGLAEFVRQAWHLVTPGVPFQDGWHIDAICLHLEAVSKGDIKQLVINVPPRHGKSTIVSVMWPAWDWIHYPHRRWLFASYAASLSTRDSVFCRQVIRSHWYRQRWGEKFELARDANLKNEFKNSEGGYRVATSVGGTATGKGGDILVCDDPHSLSEVYSELKRESAINWWSTVMSTRVNDQRTSARVVVMQRVHQRDVTAVCLDEGGYEHLCLPQRYPGGGHKTSIGWFDPRVERGELLWPDRVDAEQDKQMRRKLGTYDATSQLDQAPAPRGGNVIKHGWTRYYEVLPADLTDWRQSWDLTFKGRSTSDYVVGQVWARKGAAYYLVDQVRAQMDVVATIAAIKNLSARWPKATRKLVEDKANGPAVMSLLQREVVGLTAWPPKGQKHPDKMSRVHAVSPLFEAHNVNFPHPSIAPWIADMVAELTTFPAGQHDDQVDACTQALLDYTAKPRFVLV